MYSTIDANTQTIGLETITNSWCLTWPECNVCNNYYQLNKPSKEASLG
jgi:hypothetical protein